MRNTGFRRLIQGIVLLMAVASCGFTPVYAPGSQTAQKLSEIAVAAPNGQYSYLFARAMEDRLGRPTNPASLLKYQITIKGEGVESDTERRRFVGAVSYELLETGTDVVLASGAVDSFAGYSVSNGLFVSAQQGAIERLISIMADQLTRELMVKLAAQ